MRSMYVKELKVYDSVSACVQRLQRVLVSRISKLSFHFYSSQIAQGPLYCIFDLVMLVKH